MIPRTKHPGFVASLIAALMYSAGAVQAAPKPIKPLPLLGSHPSKDALTARTTLLKERSKSVSVRAAPPGKIANSLNRHPGKTIVVAHKPPK